MWDLFRLIFGCQAAGLSPSRHPEALAKSNITLTKVSVRAAVAFLDSQIGWKAFRMIALSMLRTGRDPITGNTMAFIREWNCAICFLFFHLIE
jgi:hypothetical protein